MDEYIDKWSVVNRLIDLENEFQHYKPFHGFEHAMYRKICEAEIAIGKTPAADVVEVVHGRWIKVGESCGVDILECSECHTIHPQDGDTFCRDCGARMDGDA